MADPTSKIVPAPPADTDTVFANVIHTTATPDEVIVAFGMRDTADPSNVKYSHRIVLTIPHFLRAADLFKKIKEQYLTQIDDPDLEAKDVAVN